jgi:hypothetical protein
MLAGNLSEAAKAGLRLYDATVRLEPHPFKTTSSQTTATFITTLISNAKPIKPAVTVGRAEKWKT